MCIQGAVPACVCGGGVGCCGCMCLCKMLCLHVCVGAVLHVGGADAVPAGYRGQKKALNPLELVLQMVVSCYVVAGN